MQLNFLKVSPKKAIEIIRSCLSDGYNLRESLLTDYGSSPNNGDKLTKWDSTINEWKEKTYKKLSKVYEAPVEPLVFQNYRAIFLDIGMGLDFGGKIVNIEGKLKILYDLYQFILTHSNIVINTKGDVIFQYGENNQAIQNEH